MNETEFVERKRKSERNEKKWEKLFVVDLMSFIVMPEFCSL